MEQLILFVLFSVPLVWSPGPVNILLAGLGANHGVYRNLPFVGGLICSAVLISIACLLGFQVILQSQTVYQWLTVAGALYIMYLSVKLYRLQPCAIEAGVVTHRFQDGLLVTLLHPKFYVMVTAIFAQFVGPGKRNAALVGLGFILILALAHIAWLGLGALLKDVTRNARRLRLLNKVMGVSLFLFAVYFLYRVLFWR